MSDKLHVLSTDEAGGWREALEQASGFDFYHLPEYHRLAEKRGEGEALMLVFRSARDVIAFPMLIRDVDLPGIGPTGLKDVTSVYGYAGPVASAGVGQDTIDGFARALGAFFAENEVVCAFSRLHPLIEQSHLLRGLGDAVELGATLSVDLTFPPEEQVARYRRNHRRDIRDLTNDGFRCEEAGPERLDEFVDMYHATMDRAGADSSYYFDKAYFDYLMTEMPGIIRLLVCLKDGVVVSGLLHGLCGGIVECHLAGTAPDYVRMAPSKLLYDGARAWGVRQNARVMHMGGGLGSRRDSIFHLKLGFGASEHVFLNWRHIADGGTYEELSRQASRYADVEPEGAFFPKYRDPALHRLGGLELGCCSHADTIPDCTTEFA